MNTEQIIIKMIEKCKSENMEKWIWLHHMLINNAIKIEKNKNEFDIVSPATTKGKVRITNFYKNEPISYVEFDLKRSKQVDSLILEYFYDIEDYKITEIIELN